MSYVEINGAIAQVSPEFAAKGVRFLKKVPDAPPAEDGPPWPTLKSTENFGLVGEIAKLATANSEADPIGVMGTVLAFGAASFGRNRWLPVGDTSHHARLFVALVGASSRARKGTSIDPVRKIFTAAECSLHQWGSEIPKLQLSNGPMSSGEGLVDAIRDKRGDNDQGGTDDKRLLCTEGELGSVLRAFQRQGNNLGMIVRTAWDGSSIAPLTKANKIKASEPHVCIVGHITSQELRTLLNASDIWNGFANRILWLAVHRTRLVAFPKAMPGDEVARIGEEVARVIQHAHSARGELGRVQMSNSAAAHWADVYPELTRDQPGIFGAVTSRAEAQALRLALTFALFDGSSWIELKHVEAGLTFWRYCFDSAFYIFGTVEADPIAQRVLDVLGDRALTRTQINDLFGGHRSAQAIKNALRDLQKRGRIECATQETGGRSRELWRLTGGKSGISGRRP